MQRTLSQSVNLVFYSGGKYQRKNKVYKGITTTKSFWIDLEDLAEELGQKGIFTFINQEGDARKVGWGVGGAESGRTYK